ncbi:hypothetical protein EGW08_021414 [Elysia chlorotica]|uniref:SGNH domain-containing protein n=1 Tax=Elysia chlorotica TaxID=188477 RepID=A0A433SNU5_ELYCH|nr:hypothetical protein EGW08_021414 [Elysia chlorotica]
MALLSSRPLVPWCPAKPKIYRLIVVVIALMVMAPGLLMWQRVKEIVADHSGHAHRLVRKFIISDDEGYFGYVEERNNIKNTNVHRIRRAEEEEGDDDDDDGDDAHKVIGGNENIQYKLEHFEKVNGDSGDAEHINSKSGSFHLKFIEENRPEKVSRDFLKKKQIDNGSGDSEYTQLNIDSGGLYSRNVRTKYDESKTDITHFNDNRPNEFEAMNDFNESDHKPSKNENGGFVPVKSELPKEDEIYLKHSNTSRSRHINGDYNVIKNKENTREDHTLKNLLLRGSKQDGDSLVNVKTELSKNSLPDKDHSEDDSVTENAHDTPFPLPRNLKYTISATSRQGRHMSHETTQVLSASSTNDQQRVAETGQRGAHHVGCKGVLTRAVVGKWIPRAYSQVELDTIQSFLNKTRDNMGLPPSLQRDDKKCDKITYKWFRALCNPFGGSPCCEETHCVSRSVEECQCDGCMDLRQQVHAELATWVPVDTDCQFRPYTPGEEACTALEDFTVHFVGDSLLRQIFVALLHLLKVPEPELNSKGKACLEFFIFKPVWFFVGEIGGFFSSELIIDGFQVKTYYTPEIVKEMRRYVGRPNSLVVLGMGMHDHLNSELILQTVVKPIIAAASNFNSSWPKLVWAAPHAPGLLKSPWLPSQLRPSVLNFNRLINAAFTSAGIPVMDTFGLTKDGVMTYDGLHYGEGVNRLKAQILMNYVQEIRNCKRDSRACQKDD